MRAIYITINNLEQSSDGVAKKCLDQISALKFLGFQVSVFYLCRDVLIFKDEKGGGKRIRLFNKYLFLSRVSTELMSLTSVNVVFLRNPHGGLHPIFLTQVVRAARRIGERVVLDVPHFPYDREGRKFSHRISIWLHRLNRPFLRSYVHLISYTGQLTGNIWRLPSLRVFNAVEVERFPRREDERDRTRGRVTFLGVAHLAHWHGYDRIIRGLHHYQKRGRGRDVRLIIVGDGQPELERLRRLVGDLGLHEFVTFTGKLSGDELDFQYLQADIGVDSLGRHRSGNNYNCSIKSKEFAARGIPFIKSHQDDAFSNASFVLTLSADETPVDIAAVITWYENAVFSSNEISDYVRESLTWKIQMKRILMCVGCLPQ